MTVRKIQFSRQRTDFYFGDSFGRLRKRVPVKEAIVLTDETIFAAHPKKFKDWNVIVLKPGEEHKIQSTVDSVIERLVAMKVDRNVTLIGVGGGVITDLTGYIASIYLRGVAFGFVPTSLLGMVDAAIGGKNGIDVGMYKNIVGTINQPQFLVYDTDFLKTLPATEWRNGFAEIIKHAAIADAAMFSELEDASVGFYQKNKTALQQLVRRNALLKAGVVKRDEFEQNTRRLLNFGHTLAHALEKEHNLMHGEAVAIGMAFAAQLSHRLLGFKHPAKLVDLIGRYGLPVTTAYDKQKTFDVLTNDKKREGGVMNFVLLQKIGKAVIQKIPLEKLQTWM